MKMFDKILMASEFDTNLLKTGVFYDEDGAEAAVEDGAVVSIGELMPHDLYAGLKDLNARKITAYAAGSIVGVIDYVGVPHADANGVTYRVGEKIYGIAPEAGERVRVRMLNLGDEFYLGDENFDTAPDATTKKYAAPEEDETTWKVSTTKAESGLCIQIENTKTLITGQVNGGTLYRCRVIAC